MNIVLPEINPDFEDKKLIISEAEYHANRKVVHSSALKHMIKSPHAFYWNAKYPKDPTKQMKLGTLAHKAILEGRDFLENYIVEPVFKGFTAKGEETTSLNCKEVKEKKAFWYSELRPDQQVVTQIEYDKIAFMMESMVKHKFVQEYLKDGQAEVRGQFKHKTDIGVYFAVDFLSFDCENQIEVKTCSDSSAFKFCYQIEDMAYYMQEAIYHEGIFKVFAKKPKNRIWIAVENVPPYETKVHFVDALYQSAGEYEFNESMLKLKYCLENNYWMQGQMANVAIEPSYRFRTHYERLLEQ